MKSFFDALLKQKKSPQKLLSNVQAKLPTSFGIVEIYVFMTPEGAEHAALVHGTITKTPLVRIHSSCFTGDIFSSKRCDCGEQLALSMKLIADEKSGIVIYLNQEGRGIGLTNKIKAYALQEQGYDTVEANLKLGLPVDARDYRIAALILNTLHVSEIRLLTNNPDKIKQLEKYGVQIKERVPLEVDPGEHNLKYLKTKKEKLGHLLTKI